MRVDPVDFTPLRFSTDALPAAQRLRHWRDFARKVVCIDIEPLSDALFDCQAMLRALPGLRSISWGGSPARFARTPKIVSEGGDTLGLVVNLDGAATALQRDAEISLGVGDAALMLHSEPAALVQSYGRGLCLVLPRTALTPLVDNIEDAAMRPIPHGNGPLRLLMTYLIAVRDDITLATPALRHSVATHVQDLVGMAIGATRDGAASASQRGVRAARLAAVKSDVREHLAHQSELTLADVAARQGLGPRYIQKLFEADGSTFSSFLLEEKLARAHRMLTDARYATSTISSIAFAASFGDLSYFHRMYRRRYGATPAEMRNDARGPNNAK